MLTQNPGDGGVLVLDLVGGAEHLVDVGVVAERGGDVPGDAAGGDPVDAAHPVPAERRPHQALPVGLRPRHLAGAPAGSARARALRGRPA